MIKILRKKEVTEQVMKTMRSMVGIYPDTYEMMKEEVMRWKKLS